MSQHSLCCAAHCAYDSVLVLKVTVFYWYDFKSTSSIAPHADKFVRWMDLDINWQVSCPSCHGPKLLLVPMLSCSCSQLLLKTITRAQARKYCSCQCACCSKVLLVPIGLFTPELNRFVCLLSLSHLPHPEQGKATWEFIRMVVSASLSTGLLKRWNGGVPLL